jgi:hypothetical protein
MLLDFLEMKSHDNFLNFLVKSKGSGNHVFAEECITEELNTMHFIPLLSSIAGMFPWISS